MYFIYETFLLLSSLATSQFVFQSSDLWLHVVSISFFIVIGFIILTARNSDMRCKTKFYKNRKHIDYRITENLHVYLT